MAVEEVHDFPNSDTHRALHVVPELDAPNPENEEEPSEDERDEQALELFDQTFFAEFGHTPADTLPQQSKEVAHYIDAFAHFMAAQQIQQRPKATVQKEGAEPIQPSLIPRVAIRQRIDWYYDSAFGTDRRSKNAVKLSQELEFLKRKNAVSGRIYAKGTTTNAYRHEVFPQLGFMIDLEYLLRNRGDQVAADCAETVLALHGDRILGLAVTAGRQAVASRDSRRDAHNIIHWNEEDIPIDVRAERPRYPKRAAPAE